MNWPLGIESAGASAGIKASGDKDMGLIVTTEPVRWAGTFTKNAAAAACVEWSRSLLDKKVHAIVVNSGNANACTGPAGHVAVKDTATATAVALGCTPEEVLVASTGPIGVPLPTELLRAAIPGLAAGTRGSTGDFSEAILTTDSVPKVSSARAGDALVVGVAKGAAMLAPNMATMLAFISTDARIDADLQTTLDVAVRTSFDRICVDACESTNDSVFLLATEQIDVDAEAFERALRSVCSDLAEQMVRDAEGASKFVRIQVSGAASEDAAASLGKAVASSALWRAAVHGADPNWGRILSALGSADRALDLSMVSIAIGAETLFDGGIPTGSLDAAAKSLAGDDITVSCIVGTGPGAAEILTTDLSEEYVTLNAEIST